MLAQAKIQKWGNSSAVRLSSKLLAAAGIPSGSEVDIQADSGRLVIKVKEHSQEQPLTDLLAREPGAAELIAEVKASLANAISMTEATTERCNQLVAELDRAGDS